MPDAVETQARRGRAVGLLSGGADSLLAARLVLEQGVEVIALHCRTSFFGCGGGNDAGLKRFCDEHRIELREIMLGDEFLKMLADPKFGYGKATNPCIDCHLMMMRKAREVMLAEGADFVFTGEVLGQRPMSQHMPALRRIEEEGGLRGKLLRPLSARLMTPTIAEMSGLVDRNSLPAISGRSRREQMQLAEELELESLPGASGGCVLTELRFGDKVRDMFEHAGDKPPSLNDAELLRFGRHMRKTEGFKIVVGKSRLDNLAIESPARRGDLLFATPDESLYVGPLTLARGEVPREQWEWIASVLLRYADVDAGTVMPVAVLDHNGVLIAKIETAAIDADEVPKYMIAGKPEEPRKPRTK